MGVHKNISMESFPVQGAHYGKLVDVIFNYDSSKSIRGVVVMDDMDEPFITAIKLNDGRFVLATECQYSISKDKS